MLAHLHCDFRPQIAMTSGARLRHGRSKNRVKHNRNMPWQAFLLSTGTLSARPFVTEILLNSGRGLGDAANSSRPSLGSTRLMVEHSVLYEHTW